MSDLFFHNPLAAAQGLTLEKNKFEELSQLRRMPESWTADDVTEAIEGRETVR